MSTVITAGNATNGLSLSADNAAALEFKTGAGAGTTAMAINSSQNVGIGTTSPNGQLSFGLGSSSAAVKTYNNNDISGISTYALTTDGTRYYDIYSNGAPNNAAGGSNIRFLTNSITAGTFATERARIDAGGNVLVGTTSPIQSGTFSVLGSASTAGFRTTATAGSGIVLDVSRTSATGDMIYFRTSSTTLAGFITCPTGTTTSYASVSDYRLKENVQPMTGALAKVAQLKPCTYIWKHDNSDGQGFIAHELQAVVPDAVVGEKDAVNEDGSIKPQAIDTSFLVATLTAAIQEQQLMIQELSAKVAALEAR